jgi:hypothetical protein
MIRPPPSLPTPVTVPVTRNYSKNQNQNQNQTNNQYTFNIDVVDLPYQPIAKDLTLEEIQSTTIFKQIERELARDALGINDEMDEKHFKTLFGNRPNKRKKNIPLRDPSIEHKIQLIHACLLFQTSQNSHIINFINCKTLLPWMVKIWHTPTSKESKSK